MCPIVSCTGSLGLSWIKGPQNIVQLHQQPKSLLLTIRTWLRAIEADLKTLNIDLSSAWKKATSRETWRSVVDTVTLKKSMTWEEEENGCCCCCCRCCYVYFCAVGLNNKCIVIIILVAALRVNFAGCWVIVWQLAEVDDQLFTKRKEMGGIYGPLDHRLRLMKRRDHLERKENQVPYDRHLQRSTIYYYLGLQFLKFVDFDFLHRSNW